MAFRNVNLKIESAARAKKLADDRGIAVSALLADLVDAAYAARFGADEVSAVAVADNVVTLRLFGANNGLVDLMRGHASEFSRKLRDSANGLAKLNGAQPSLSDMPSISRRGTAVVIEAKTRSGEDVRKTMSTRDANNLADEISSALD